MSAASARPNGGTPTGPGAITARPTEANPRARGGRVPQCTRFGVVICPVVNAAYDLRDADCYDNGALGLRTKTPEPSAFLAGAPTVGGPGDVEALATYVLDAWDPTAKDGPDNPACA